MSSPILICAECERKLSTTSDAMRRHASLMDRAIYVAKSSSTEEQRQDLGRNLVASFNEAQSAWDAYREHLKEHGILPH